MDSSEGSITPPQAAPKLYGASGPISTAGPTEIDVRRTSELEKFLVEVGLYESSEEAAKREDVLREIDQIVKAWVKQLTRQEGTRTKWLRKQMPSSIHLVLTV